MMNKIKIFNKIIFWKEKELPPAENRNPDRTHGFPIFWKEKKKKIDPLQKTGTLVARTDG